MFAFATVAVDWLKTNLKKDEGQTMAEYGLILAIVAIAVAVTLGVLATGISGTLTNVVKSL